MKTSGNLYKYITGLTFVTGAILLIPLIAMQFTNEVVWTLGDFIFAGTLIFGTCLAYKLVTIGADEITYKIAIGVALAAGFFLIWANGAVGIIGSEANPINLLYYGVVLIGMIGAIIARFHPHGMSLTLYSAAFCQTLIAAIALVGGYFQSPPGSVMEILGVNGFFIVLWIISALLFRQAGREQLSSSS